MHIIGKSVNSIRITFCTADVLQSRGRRMIWNLDKHMKIDLGEANVKIAGAISWTNDILDKR